MDKYAIAIEVLEGELAIAIESGDEELATNIKATLQYLKDVSW